MHKISIIPRGIGALGYTQQLPLDERFLLQQGELTDRLAVLLGGRAAEELFFHEISSGASNDLERASDIARRMVTELGMSPLIGPVTLVRRRDAAFLNGETPGAGAERNYSEATAQEIDHEVQRMLNAAHDQAFGILERQHDVLEKVAKALLEKEVIDRDELRALMGKPPVQSGDPQRPEVGHVPSQEAAD